MPDDTRETMRIAHYLARCGVASRRKAEELVRAGRVVLNGEAITDLGRQVDPAADKVTVDGAPVRLEATHLTLVIHKPVQVVVSRTDPQGRRTIYDLIPPAHASRARELVYAGRLDYMTSGFQLLSTDGELVNRLTHPRHKVEKAYHVTTTRPLAEEELVRLREGIDLEDGRTLPCEVRALRGDGPARYEFVLREGRNRQVRRMVEAVGARIASLTRTRVGGLSLATLALREGQAAVLDEAAIIKLLGKQSQQGSKA